MDITKSLVGTRHSIFNKEQGIETVKDQLRFNTMVCFLVHILWFLFLYNRYKFCEFPLDTEANSAI